MKINEVIVEGVLDYAKGLLKTRSLAGAKSANQQAQGKKQFDEYLGKVVQKWNEYTGGTGDTDVVKWASNFFDGNLSAIPRPANSNPDTITKYLSDVTRAYKSGQLTKGQTNSTPRDSAPTTGQSTATIGALGKRATKQPTQEPTQSHAYQSPLGITIRQSTDPVIVDYNGKPYMLNDRGQWAKDGGNSNAAEAGAPVQAEIDKVLTANNVLGQKR
jgi:hypothetical protein